MAKYERRLTASFDEVLDFCERAITGASMSASYEDGSDVSLAHVRVAVRVYERYSMFGSNRVSLNLTLVGEDDDLYLTAITAGGSEAVLFKVNTLGEKSFLDTLVSAVERHYP